MQSCSNYRGIKLVSHTMKLWEKLVEAGLRSEVRISEQESDFMPRNEHCRYEICFDSVYGEVDLEKAYDRVPREEML